MVGDDEVVGGLVVPGLPADGGSAADGPRCRWRTSPGIAAVFARAQPCAAVQKWVVA